MNGTTITVSGLAMEAQHLRLEPVKAKAEVEAKVEPKTRPKSDPGMDGLNATLKAIRQMGLNIERVPMAIVRMLYYSGVAFAVSDRSTEEDRQAWRNSIIWPTVKDSGEQLEVHLHLQPERKK